ncbi:MAG: trypsin-like peptidase domain-containing protein [Candidatus Marinimicrobia bacterium]|nr:trypsin-like peptidase domain-containing protein [Candidatus Neomarinimicrobiota bacterium]
MVKRLFQEIIFVLILAFAIQSRSMLFAQEKDEVNSSIYSGRMNAITRTVAEASPAVAGINAIQVREYSRTPFANDPIWSLLFPDRVFRQRVKSLGSGFLISPDGYVLTNSHVIENAVEVVVTLSDGTDHEAEIIGVDEVSDISLIKLKGNDFPYLKLGKSDDIIIGEWVIALGNPFGLFDISKKPTATVGVISGVDLDFGQQESGRVYQDMIQTDASINSGNSGGPLLNAVGEVIGVNTFIFTGGRFSEGSIGIGFAIPINRAKSVYEELKAYGKVDRSFWTGMTVQDLNRLLAKHLDLENEKGVIVTNVEKNSPASGSGIQVGDIILKVNGSEIIDDDDILKIIEENFLRAGDSLTLLIRRGTTEKTVHLRLGNVKK